MSDRLLRIVEQEITNSTGPTGGWLDSPKAVMAAIAKALAAAPAEQPLVCDTCGQNLNTLERNHYTVRCHKPGCEPPAMPSGDRELARECAKYILDIWRSGSDKEGMISKAVELRLARVRRKERERAAQQITPEFFQRHETSYQQLPQGGYFWSCSCSANFQDVLGWEECHEKTREHWSAMLAAAIRKGETDGQENQADQQT